MEWIEGLLLSLDKKKFVYRWAFASLLNKRADCSVFGKGGLSIIRGVGPYTKGGFG